MMFWNLFLLNLFYVKDRPSFSNVFFQSAHDKTVVMACKKQEKKRKRKIPKGNPNPKQPPKRTRLPFRRVFTFESISLIFFAAQERIKFVLKLFPNKQLQKPCLVNLRPSTSKKLKITEKVSSSEEERFSGPKDSAKAGINTK